MAGAAELNAIISATIDKFDGLLQSLSNFSASFTNLASSLLRLVPGVDKLGDIFSTVAPLITNLATELYKSIPGLSTFITKLGDVTGAFGGVIGSIGGMVGSLGGFVGVAGSFVNALNPGLMDILNDTIGDLVATIGQAFQPVIEAVIPIIRQMANILGPAMQDLGPPLAEFVSVIASLLIPITRLFAVAIKTIIIPIIKFFAEALKLMIKAIAIFTVSLLKLLSYLPFIGGVFGKAANAVTEAFNPKQEEGGGARRALTNFSFGNIEDVLKSNIIAAQRAGAAANKTTDQFLSDIYTTLKSIQKFGVGQGSADGEGADSGSSFWDRAKEPIRLRFHLGGDFPWVRVYDEIEAHPAPNLGR